MREILAFPDHIRVVPSSPIGPSGEDAQWSEKAAAWQRWASGVQRYRVERRLNVQNHPDLIPIELERCRRDHAYWLTTYGWIFEPRPMRDRAPHTPFIPYPFQIDALDWFEELLDTDGPKGDGVLSKSRDMGASWLAAAFALHGFLFKKVWQFTFVSWRADEVDAPHANSIFWKIEYLMKSLPTWMLPEGWDWQPGGRCRRGMLFSNPVNGNAISGQASTERAMRGGRSTAVVYDEAAINKLLEASWSGTANVTYHRIAISSEHLDFNDFFYRLRTGRDMEPEERPSLFETDYWLHFGHDQQWLEWQRERNASTPGAFEREVLRDPLADDRTFVYPDAKNKQPIQIESIDGVPIFCGIDPGYSDECAFVLEEYHPDGRMKVMQAHQRKQQTADFWGTILRGTPWIRTNQPLTPEQVALFDTGIINQMPDEDLPKGWERIGKYNDGEEGQWSYSPHEYTLMEWMRHRLADPNGATWYGDISGMASLGASKDTVYSRLKRFGIRVNTDRTRDGKVTAHKMQARTYKGRQEAMKEQLPRLDFNDSYGARLALNALQDYRWGDEDGGRRTAEPKTPEHKRSSHLTTAMEYIAVNRYIRRRMESNPLPQPYRAGRSANASITARPRVHG